MDYSRTEINLLEVKVFKSNKNNQLKTCTQNKRTHIKTSLPEGQVVKINRISFNTDDLQVILSNLAYGLWL